MSRATQEVPCNVSSGISKISRKHNISNYTPNGVLGGTDNAERLSTALTYTPVGALRDSRVAARYCRADNGYGTDGAGT